jgi:hypothetical protein
VSVASVDQNGIPTVTPIGSLFLNDNQTGFYFEKYPTSLPEHAKQNKQVSVLAVNSSSLFWIKSLFSMKFSSHPAIRLYGQLGQRRKATEQDLQRLKRRMRATRMLKGNAYLWGKMEFVREIEFQKAEKMNLGKMTDLL